MAQRFAPSENKGRSILHGMARSGLVALLCMQLLACEPQRLSGAGAASPDASSMDPPDDAGPSARPLADAALMMNEQQPGSSAGEPSGAGDASVDTDAGRPETPDHGECPSQGSSDYEAVETRCDGIDNDCDGWVDVLLPTAENRCQEAEGCVSGFASCRRGARVCSGEGASAEVFDGLDNDCNGAIDDADRAPQRPRALLLFAPYLVTEGGAGIDNVAASLEQWGIPYDRPEADQLFEQQLEALSGYPLAILPGYNVGEFLTEGRVSVLRDYVEAGGTLVVWKPVLTSDGPANGLLGLVSSEKRKDVEALQFEGTSMRATRVFDAPEEQHVPLTAVVEEERPDVWVLQPGPDVEVGARALIGDQSVGALLTRHALGDGVVYAVGHDLLTFRHTRCYVNCFEPSSDLAGLFLREVFRDSVRGHVAWKHTVPGLLDSWVIMSHDVDALDAQNADKAWGAAGAEQVAELERELGARGSFFITTDYLEPYYNPQLMTRLCELGACPAGVHSVRHGGLTQSVPVGDCTETRASYFGEQTLCGEVRVPIEILMEDVGVRARAWRAPYLYVHPQLFDVLDSQGIVFDSSYAVGDLKFNLPLSLARVGLNQHIFHHHAMYTMPIVLEDGIGDIVEGVETREEMSDYNARKFQNRWRYAMLRNADNRAHTMVLLHPSYGLGVAKDNLKNKLAVERRFLQDCLAREVKVDATVDELLDFWRAREATDIDVRFEGDAYTGTIRTGSYAMRGLTLEFGDAIDAFDCSGCGATQLRDKRVFVEETLAPESSYTFSARVRK